MQITSLTYQERAAHQLAVQLAVVLVGGGNRKCHLAELDDRGDLAAGAHRVQRLAGRNVWQATNAGQNDVFSFVFIISSLWLLNHTLVNSFHHFILICAMRATGD